MRGVSASRPELPITSLAACSTFSTDTTLAKLGTCCGMQFAFPLRGMSESSPGASSDRIANVSPKGYGTIACSLMPGCSARWYSFHSCRLR